MTKLKGKIEMKHAQLSVTNHQMFAFPVSRIGEKGAGRVGMAGKSERRKNNKTSKMAMFRAKLCPPKHHISQRSAYVVSRLDTADPKSSRSALRCSSGIYYTQATLSRAPVERRLLPFTNDKE